MQKWLGIGTFQECKKPARVLKYHKKEQLL